MEIKRGLALWVRESSLAPKLAHSEAEILALTRVLRLFLEDAWMIMLQLPEFPNGWYFVWEGTPATV